MKTLPFLALVFGLALIGLVVAHTGIGPVVEAVERVGWLGFALIVVTGFSLTALPGAAFWALVAGAPLRVFITARQVRDSVGDLLPFTQFGGIVAGVRVLAISGVPVPKASAAAIVDVTAEFVAQIVFIALGLVLAINRLHADPVFAAYARPLMLGTALLVPAAAAFIALQKGSSFLTRTLAALFLPVAWRSTEAFTGAIDALYAKPLRFVLCALLHLAGWVASGMWLYAILRLAGASVSLPSAIAMQSLLEALRSAAVFVPSSLGVQEVGYAALAPLFGMGAEVGLAASLIRRARDLAVGIPVLLLWQVVEGGRIVKGVPRRPVG